MHPLCGTRQVARAAHNTLAIYARKLLQSALVELKCSTGINYLPVATHAASCNPTPCIVMSQLSQRAACMCMPWRKCIPGAQHILRCMHL